MEYIAQHPFGFSFTVDNAGERVTLAHGDRIEIVNWEQVANAKRVRPWLCPVDVLDSPSHSFRLDDLSLFGLRKLAGVLGIDDSGGTVRLSGRLFEALNGESLALCSEHRGMLIGLSDAMTVVPTDAIVEYEPSIFEHLGLEHLNKSGLVALGSALELPTDGTAEELVARISAVLALPENG